MESKSNPSIDKATNLIDVTIIGNPPPQASSTVERKTTLGTWDIRRVSHDGTKTRRHLLNDSDLKHTTSDSSLGILDNISSCKSLVLGDSGVMEERRTSTFSNKIDTERELARKLLQRCSEPRQSSIFSDRDKENDGNFQNLSPDYTPSTLVDSGRQSFVNRSRTLQDQESQVIFKPNEISARSSVLNSSSNKSFGSSTSPPRKGGISFDTTAAAELMAQFGDEDFQSGSRVGSQMLADELAWNQNCSYAMPVNVPSSGEKERLDLSCFSGIIGEFDLSSESTAGRKVSVGEFFQRKCGNIGHLQETDSISRPSFGVTINSPTKHERVTPLIDETTMTEEPGVAEGYRKATGSVNDTKQHSLMSLSCIAQVLNDVENGTPRRLVDELIQARRNKKLPQSQLAKTDMSNYTYPVESSSFDSSSFRVNETPERDTTTNRPMSLLDSPRFSLDTKIALDPSRSKLKPTRMSLNVVSEMGAGHNASGSYNTDCLTKHVDESNKTYGAVAVKSLTQLKKIKKSSSYHSNVTRNLLNSLEDSNFTCDRDPNLPSIKLAVDRSENDSYSERKPFHVPQVLPNSPLHSKTFHEPESVPVQSPAAYLKDIMYENERILLPGRNESLKQSPRKATSNRSEDVRPNDAEITSNFVKRDHKVKSSFNGGSFDQHKGICSDGNSVSARNTSELFSCIVGISREAEIEILNKSERWMTCSLTLHQMQASEEYITFNLPGDTLLVEPDRGKLVKVGVNVRQMRQPILAVIHIAVSDMVTRSSKVIKHVMCFVPEEPQIGVTTSLRRDNADFQVLPERCGKAFPVTFENKNNTELPVKIMISKHPEESQVFSIAGFANEDTNVINQGGNDVDYNLRLKPHEKFTIKVHFVGTTLAALNILRKGVSSAKLVIQLRTDETEGLVLKEIPLGVGDCSHVCDQSSNNVQRCTTPQSRQLSSPDSPHSPASNRSGNSGRHSPGSAASTSTVSGDVIPIQSTHAALVWSSLKTGRSDTKVFTILNKSENKIKLQVNIVDNNKSFKFVKDRNATGSMLLVLQRMGSKEISVMFSPNNPGACAGKIIFTHYNNLKDQDESTQRKTIFLYGYGGIGKVEISQAFKDTGGLMWLSLGHMNPDGRLSAKIKLQNTGDLCSYAVVKLTPKALYPAMISSWHVNPAELLLGPGETQWIKLEFHPRREDLALLRRAHVSHVGTISITHGDEPTRWRIRRLYNKLKESGKLRGAENDTFRNIVFPLCKAFPGEALIQDLGLIRDSVQHLGDLCRGVSQHQVMLTMEVNADETMTMLNDNADDTQVFHSVCSDNSSILTSGCDSYMPSDTLTDGNERELSESDFTVTPRAVGLAPPFRTEATITVTSLCNVAQPFETILSHRDCLSVVPTEGMIPAGRSFPLKVQCHKEFNRSLCAVLQIFVENQKREVSITISKK